jgi:hypothetical protein
MHFTNVHQIVFFHLNLTETYRSFLASNPPPPLIIEFIFLSNICLLILLINIHVHMFAHNFRHVCLQVHVSLVKLFLTAALDFRLLNLEPIITIIFIPDDR